MGVETLPEGWASAEWEKLTASDGFRRGPFGGNLKKSFFVPKGFAVYEQYSPINDDCSKFRYFIDDDKYQELSSFWVTGGDFLISCAGTMGRITQVPKNSPAGVINQALLRVRLLEELIDSNYFLKLFRSPVIQEKILTKAVGGAIQNLAAVKELKTIEFPLPPLAEQKVIAEKLDTLLAQVETTKARLDRIPHILKRFRQSVLAAAVSGKLTEDWRTENPVRNASELFLAAKSEHKHHLGKKYKEPDSLDLRMLEAIPETWEYAASSYLMAPGAEIVYGIVQPGPKLENGVPYVRGADIQNGKILVDQLMKTSEKIAQKYERASLCGGDILLGIIRATKVAVVPDELRGANITQGTARFRPIRSVLDNKYLAFYLESPKVQAWLHSHYRGIDMPGLNLKDVRMLPVALPSKEEQTEIVHRVERLFAFADKIEQQVQQAQQRVNHLTQSILAKAFRGELTEQWRRDHPDLISGEHSALALLDKIRTERAASSKSSTTKKKATAKKPKAAKS